MQEIYSKTEDCIELARILKKKMGNKIEFYGSIYQNVISGKYYEYHGQPHSNLDYLFEKVLSFYYKFNKDGFLRIEVGDTPPCHYSLGRKLAALSEFYEVLHELFGVPTVFYTTKNDDEGKISLQWSFINKEEEIKEFKNGTYFDDAEIDKLIVIGESTEPDERPKTNDNTKNSLASIIGLPLELINLDEEDIEEYVEYKKRILAK